MKTPFSQDELKTILDTDTGFKNFLATLSPTEARDLTRIVSDGSILQNALNALPAPFKERVSALFNDIVNVPKEGMRLYAQCRFFEAREYLLKTIDLYASPSSTAFEPLDKAAAFATRRLQSLCYNLLGDVESVLGNTEKAGRRHDQALQLAEAVEDTDTICKALQGLGTYYLESGDLEQGEAHCRKALDLITGREDRWRLRVKILTTLSVFFSEVGRFAEALQYAEAAVDLCTPKEDDRALPVCLNNLACIQVEAGDPDLGVKALMEALRLAQQQQDSRQEVLILNNLAVIFLRRDLPGENILFASSFIKTALLNSSLMVSPSFEALSFGSKALLCQVLGKPEEAANFFYDAFRIYRRIGAKPREAMVLIHLASHLKDHLNDMEGAFQACKRAIDIIEGIRWGLKTESHRISYAAKEADPYELMVDALLALDRPDEALEYVERAKSRALLDFLAGKAIDRMAVGSDPEVFHRASRLLAEIDEIQKNLGTILTDQEISMEAIKEDWRGGYAAVRAPLLEELSQKERAFEQAFSELNKLDPERASMLKVSPLTKNQIQGLAGEGTLFLELYQTEETLRMFPVAGQEPVRAMSVDLSVREGSELVQSLMEALRAGASLDTRSHEFIRQVRQPLASLFDRLIAPLKPLLDQCRRLIISPHLFWHYLPFHALYDRDEQAYLCDRIEVGYCPSASVLRLCQEKNHTGRERALILSRNTGDLPYVDQEAELLFGAFYPNGEMFKGDDAHLGRVRKTTGPYDMIHMACHGRFDPDQPFLSGIDLPAEASMDRRTYLLDLYGLSLDCNLATLSACDTGVSRITSADELIGMSRGLFYAGAASVMLSLWQVSDASTCYFMENFYWHYIKNSRTKTRAIQLAMQAVKSREEYAHPYYWAPFVVMGDWR